MTIELWNAMMDASELLFNISPMIAIFVYIVIEVWIKE